MSPGLARGCAAVWDCVLPAVKGEMTVRGATKYLIFGVCPGFAGRFNYFGTKVYFPRASAVFRLACENGGYEPEITALLCRLAQPNKLFIDVGANIGLMSIPVLRSVEHSRVLSFEPSPNSLPYLQQTWSESDLRSRWEIVPKAAADCAGMVEFCLAAPRYGGWDGFRDTKQAGETRTVQIPQTTVDTEWNRLGCPPVACMKIDVEGAENKVLKGAEELVRRERPHVLLEWSRVNLSPHGTDTSFILDYAASHNYDLVALPSLAPIAELHALELNMLRTEMFLLVPRRLNAEGPNLN